MARSWYRDTMEWHHGRLEFGVEPYRNAMADLDQLIEQATRHVVDGRRIVERQRQRIEDGTSGSNAIELLRSFEQSQEIFEADLARLLWERESTRKSA